MHCNAGLVEDFRSRDLLVQTTSEHELAEHLAGAPRTVYCGFDPTADSLHIGHLVPLLALRRFQLAGHRPIALMGGATGLVGDPSFKAAERGLNEAQVVTDWSQSIQRQVQRFFDTSGPAAAILVNNLEWFGNYRVLDFLREVGKSFSVNAMIRKDSVRQRIEREGEGISFAEFSYMLLQSYDFAELNRRYDCTIQIGGSDQWGNITAGIDLCWKQNRSRVHALTFPLVTKADGSKFGKTESGTVWLDAARTSPYAFYQFWLNTSDADVYRFLRFFSFIPPDDIAEMQSDDANRSATRFAQQILAREITGIVHGNPGLESAIRITDAMFSERLEALSESDLKQLRLDGLPASSVRRHDLGKPLTRLLVEAGVAQTGKQVKDALSRGAVSINGHAIHLEHNQSVEEQFSRGRALFGRYYLLRLGKKHHHLFELLD